MEKSKRPSKKQKETLNFIGSFIAAHGYGPSYRDIMRGLDYKSVATVAAHIDNLVALGLLKKGKHARSLEVVGSTTTIEDIRKVNPADEKWLVAQVEGHFRQAESAQKPSSGKVDELYVLVGSLKILGFEGAYEAFRSRLATLKKRV